MLDAKDLEVNEEEIKRINQYKSDFQWDDLSKEILAQNQLKFKGAIAIKLEEKLRANFHYSSGLLKVWHWITKLHQHNSMHSQDNKLDIKFDLERGIEASENFKKIIELNNPKKTLNLKKRVAKLMRNDLCFILNYVTDARKEHENSTAILFLQQQLGLSNGKTDVDKICRDYIQLFDAPNYGIFENFGQILMGMRFSQIYSVLDHFENDLDKSDDVLTGKSENQNPSKVAHKKDENLLGQKLYISERKKVYLARVFGDIYAS